MGDESKANVARPSLLGKVSVIIAVYNGAELLDQCLESLSKSTYGDYEVIVVDDGSTDRSDEIAERHECNVVRLEENVGPAKARNVGVRNAIGDILFFTDHDVQVQSDTIKLAVDVLRSVDPPDAVIGNYSLGVATTGYFSSYKNILHHYTHLTANRETSVFFTACGAMRRDVFDAVGGFDERIRTTAAEDIKLGYDLIRRRYRIALDDRIVVAHMKRYTFISVVTSDVFCRAIPWTRLILQERMFHCDLNTRIENCLSVLVVYLQFMVAGLFCGWLGLSGMIVTLVLAFTGVVALNRRFFVFCWRRCGPVFAIKTICMQYMAYVYSGFGAVCGVVAYALGRNGGQHKP